MMLAATLTLLWACQEKENLVQLGLRYLARHQAADGSWGQRGTSCDCPLEAPRPHPPLAAADRARIESLIRDLDDDDFRRREDALKGVIAAGEPAVALLRESAANGPPEAQWRSKTALRRIAVGGTAADLEITAMALVAFLGAGYSHLSNDVFDDRHFGTVVKEGLKWLLARQAGDGSFEGATVAGQAWAALALSEAYGMTASNPLKEPAQRAVDYIVGHPATDARGIFTQGMALKSAELSELNYPHEVRHRSAVASVVCRADEPASIFARASMQLLQIFAYRNKKLLDLTGLPGTDPSQMEIETVYVTGLTLFQADGPRGPAWTAFLERQKEYLVPSQNRFQGTCDRGAWEAVGSRERLRTCALATLSCEVYTR